MSERPRPLRLGTRLALAFGGLFLAASLGSAAAVALRASAGADQGFRRSMSTLVRVMPAGSGVSPGELKAIMGVDTAGFLPAKMGFPARLVSSLPADEERELAAMLAGPGAAERLVPGPAAVRLRGRRYQVFGAWRAAPAEASTASPEQLAMLLVPEEEIARVRAAAAWPVLLIALPGAGAAVLLAWLLASGVARPLGKLAAEAGRAAGGELAFKAAPGGGREVEDLAESLERMSAALIRAREELVRSERAAAAGQMAAAMAHEIRNPLTGAKMTLEMLLAEEQRAGAAEELRAVLDELRRLELVVDELLSFARPSPPVLGQVDAAELAGEVLGLLRRQLEHAHVRAAVRAGPGAPAARADRGKLKQVLVNLVLNAMQAQPRGGEVEVRVLPAGAGRLALEVADRGPGVKPEEAEKIFAPFYTTKSGGAGLGLAVSRSIAEEHGGRLSCDGGGGASGRGATFRLELPGW